MNDIAVYRGIIDACCFIAGYLDWLELSEKEIQEIKNLLVPICARADVSERKVIDKVFYSKDSQ